jgi:hypothetical protein
MTKAHQSTKPDAPSLTKASRYTNHQLGKNMLITRSNQQDPSLFYPWNTVHLIFLPVTPAFLSYLNCVTNHSLKNLLNLFRRLSSWSPPPNFPPFRHRAVSSSFVAEPLVPFPFPPTLPSRYITIMSRSAACAGPAATVSAARVSYLFISHILFKSNLFISSNFF